jgi:peptidoglycan glycosyltransferase
MTTYPRYDPNQLSSHNPDQIRRNWERLINDEDGPLLNRAAGALYPPGSTFKVVTAAAALENGVSMNEQLPSPTVLDVPQTSADIRNFGGSSCGSGSLTLTQALQISCNTTFAGLGIRLGSEKLAAEAEKFGFNQPSPYQLPAATSTIPADQDVPATAQSAIGQRDVRASPLQMATVAATVANGGRRMGPFVARQVVSDKGSVVKRFEGEDFGQVIPEQVASDLRDMMLQVVEAGTGVAAQIPGLQVAGKTGTAQHAQGKNPHAWFIGFTGSGDRQIAVAVVVEEGGNAGSDGTGGTGTGGTTQLGETTETRSNGNFTAVLPRPTDTAPATVTLQVDVDQADRKVGSKKKGKKQKKGRKITCLAASGQTTLTLVP